MKRVELHASWLDSKSFRGLWAPLDDAEEFILISCYVSGPAWEEFEKTLRTHLKRAAFRCTLVFSLAGLASTASRELLDRLFLLVKDHSSDDGRVRAFVIDDQGSALFHPKAHGSRAGHRTKVVVGSANLTTAAMRSNYELMTVMEDDPEVYQSLRRAVKALEDAEPKPIQITRKTIEALRNTTAARAMIERAASTQRSDRQKQHAKLELSERDYSSLLPSDADYQQAWLCVRALLGRGGYVARIDQLDSLVVSVPLAPFRQAGLLATPRIQEVGAGVSYETSGSSITVSLIPNDLRKKLTQLTKPLGKLVGRFSIECLGSRWMPLDWDEQFRSHWESVADPGFLKEAERSVEEHVEHLAHELGPEGTLRHRLGEQLEVQSPSEWIEGRVRRLLDWSRDRAWPQKLTANLRDEVVQAVLHHISTTVERRLSPSFVIAQISQVGRGPLLRQVALETITVVDALLLLSEWAMAGVTPRLRSATGELSNAPGRSGVAQVLADQFDPRSTAPEKVFEAALRWQNVAVDSMVSERDIFRALSEAWSSFVLWYGMTPEQIDWKQQIPAWSSRASHEEDDELFWPKQTEQVSLFGK